MSNSAIDQGLETSVGSGPDLVAPGTSPHIANAATLSHGKWSRCLLCGLGSGRVEDVASRAAQVCGGCTDRLELELSRGLVQVCQRCGRHPELCALLRCGQDADSFSGEAASKDQPDWRPSTSVDVAWIALDDIVEPTSESSVRQNYDTTRLAELAASLREHGFLHPVGVRQDGSKYVVIYGQRRVRAARVAGLARVPCTICVADEQRALLLSMIENLQRRQLSGKERVRAIERLAGTRLGVRELSRKTGFDQSTISRWLKIDRRPLLRTALENGDVDVGRATILADASEDQLPSLLAEAPLLSQAELRQRVTRGKALRKPTPLVSPDSRRLSDALQLLRTVRRSSPGDLAVLEQIELELDRLHVERALA
jgi:ParB family transcriptional regulator, chromosome partitioning protein